MRVTSLDLHKMALILAAKIFADKTWRPKWVVALWRGGAQWGLIVQEALKRYGIHVDHIAIRTSSYGEGANAERSEETAIHAANYLINMMQSGDNILFVDDLLDSGKTFTAIQAFIAEKAKEKPEIAPGVKFECPDMRLAVGLYKTDKAPYKPHYWVADVDPSDWVVFPHEISDFAQYEPDHPLMLFLFPDMWQLVKLLDADKMPEVAVTKSPFVI